MDYISREDAINALIGTTIYTTIAEIDTACNRTVTDDWIDGIKDAIEILSDLPAADVEERKAGKWEKYGEDMQVCSACHKYWIWAGEMYDFKYCPNCGAKMEGIK